MDRNVDRIWRAIVRPLLKAVHPRAVAHIGARDPALARHVLEHFRGTGTVVHVVEERPGFDAASWSARYGDVLELHRGAAAPGVQVVLRDGEAGGAAADQLAAFAGRPLMIVAALDAAPVRSGVDAWRAAHGTGYDVVEVPGLGGVAVLVPPDAGAAVRNELDRLRSADFLREQVQAVEVARVQREARIADRERQHTLNHRAFDRRVRDANERRAEAAARERKLLRRLSAAKLEASRSSEAIEALRAEREAAAEELARAESVLAKLRESYSWRISRLAMSVAGRLLRREPSDPLDRLQPRLRAVRARLKGTPDDRSSACRNEARAHAQRARNVLAEAEGSGAPATALRDADGDQRVDVVVYVDGAPEGIHTALAELVARTATPFRLIVAAATDDAATSAALERFVGRHPRTTLLAQPGSAAGAAVLNLGLREARSEHVVVLSHAARVTHGWLHRLLACADEGGRVAAAGPLGARPGPQAAPAPPAWLGEQAMAALVGALSRRVRPHVPFLDADCCLLRRSALEEVGVLDEDAFTAVPAALDDLTHRLRAGGFAVVVADDVYVGGGDLEPHLRPAPELLDKHPEWEIAPLVDAMEQGTALWELRQRLARALAVEPAGLAQHVESERAGPRTLLWASPERPLPLEPALEARLLGQPTAPAGSAEADVIVAADPAALEAAAKLQPPLLVAAVPGDGGTAALRYATSRWAARALGEPVATVPPAVAEPGDLPEPGERLSVLGRLSTRGPAPQPHRSLQALTELRRAFPDAVEVAAFAGPGDSPLGDVVLLDGEATLERLERADVLLDLSVVSPAPEIVLAAMGRGCVPVVSAIGPAGEVAAHDRDALLVDTGDDEAVATALAMLAGDRSAVERLRAEGIRTAARRSAADAALARRLLFETELERRAAGERRRTPSAPPARRTGALPNLLIIGAAKCGTSALHDYLDLHPDVQMSRPKELLYFVEEMNWDRGVDWYASHFDPGAAVRGESSPLYSNYPTYRGVPARAHATVPDARLLFCVRDPIERLLSHYRMRRSRSDTELLLQDELDGDPDSPYVWQGMYWLQLSQWLEHYREEQVLVIEADDLLHRRRDTVRDILRFLGLDGDFDHPGLDIVVNTSAEMEQEAFGDSLPEHPELDDRLRAALATRLGEDADALRRHTGRDFSGWSV